MPMLLKFMCRHALIGAAAAVVFVAAMLALDVGGLATLIGTSSSGTLAVALLTFFTALTFGGLQMGIAIMSMKEERDEGGLPDDAQLEPVPVRVRRR
jgi:hypothetical protein